MPRLANKMSVRAYLVAHYDTRDEVDAIIARHLDIIQKAEDFRSFAYYAADEIATLEGLKFTIDDDDDDEDEED